jgi:hypothetical protein
MRIEVYSEIKLLDLQRNELVEQQIYFTWYLHEIRNEHHVYKITPVGAVLAS